jgi:chromosome segregation ATPase
MGDLDDWVNIRESSDEEELEKSSGEELGESLGEELEKSSGEELGESSMKDAMIEDLQNILATRDSTIADLESNVMHMKEEVRATLDENDRLRQLYHERNELYHRRDEELHQCIYQLGEKTDRLAAREAVMTDLEKRLGVAEASVIRMKGEVRDTLAVNDTLNELILRRTELINQMDEQLSKSDKEAREAIMERGKIRAELKAMRSKERSLNRRLSNLHHKHNLLIDHVNHCSDLTSGEYRYRCLWKKGEWTLQHFIGKAIS